MKQFSFQLIKQFRKEAGFRQKDFAALIGVTAQQLCAWEKRSGDKSLTTTHLSRIAHALHREPSDFFINPEDPFSKKAADPRTASPTGGATRAGKRLAGRATRLD
jgi:transcriptional regulator with XRE-family HTH domain